MNNKSPCYQCQNRHVGCHDPLVCDLWAQYEQQHAVERERVQALMDDIGIKTGYIRRQRTRMLKEQRKR